MDLPQPSVDVASVALAAAAAPPSHAVVLVHPIDTVAADTGARTGADPLVPSAARLRRRVRRPNDANHGRGAQGVRPARQQIQFEPGIDRSDTVCERECRHDQAALVAQPDGAASLPAGGGAFPAASTAAANAVVLVLVVLFLADRLDYDDTGHDGLQPAAALTIDRAAGIFRRGRGRCLV